MEMENVMDDKMKKLKAMGCDIDGVMERFLNDEKFYFECYAQVMDDPGFGLLREALERGNAREAFEHAHTLKGIVANLGLTSLLEKICGLVEPLRIGKMEGLLEQYEELMQEREKYIL